MGIDWDGEPVFQSGALRRSTRTRCSVCCLGRRVPLRLHQGSDLESGSRRASRPAVTRRPDTTGTAGTATCPESVPHAVRFRVPGQRRHRLGRPDPRPDHLRARQPRGLRAAAHRRDAGVHRGQRGRRRRHGDHPRDPGRGPHQRDAQGAAGTRRARGRGIARSSPTCRSSSTRHARSCRSGATTCRWATTANAASCPRRWSTTWRCWAGGRPTVSRCGRVSEIIALFDMADINTSPAMFDVKKLESINGDYIRALRSTSSSPGARPFLDAEPWADVDRPGGARFGGRRDPDPGEGAVRGARTGRLLLPRRARHGSRRRGTRPSGRTPPPRACSTGRSRPTGRSRGTPSPCTVSRRMLAETAGLKLGKAQAPITGGGDGPNRRSTAVRITGGAGTGANAGALAGRPGTPRGRCLSDGLARWVFRAGWSCCGLAVVYVGVTAVQVSRVDPFRRAEPERCAGGARSGPVRREAVTGPEGSRLDHALELYRDKRGPLDRADRQQAAGGPVHRGVSRAIATWPARACPKDDLRIVDDGCEHLGLAGRGGASPAQGGVPRR